MALRSDGSVFAWGANYYGQINVPPDATNAIGIAAGSTHGLAVRTNGPVKLWGRFLGSGVTTVSPEATNIRAVGLGPGARHAMGLRADGSVVDWGSTGSESALLTNIPPTVANIVQVAAGSHHCLALRSDGKVIAWGVNNSGVTNVPASATNIVALASGWNHNLALRANGTLVAWGSISFLPSAFNGTNFIDVACGGNHLLGLKRDGTVVATGNNDYGQSSIPTWATNLAAIAGSGYGSLALVAAGPPVFTTQPFNRTVAIGASACFRLAAVGARPLSYQWRSNGTNLPGATNAVLLLTNVQPSLVGAYSVTVSNSLGKITSSDMLLSTTALEVTVSPLNRSAVSRVRDM